MKKLMLVFLLMSTGLFSADSLKVVWGMVDRLGNEFSADSLETISFKAKISNLASGYNSIEVTESSPGNKVEIRHDVRASCVIDFSNFYDWNWRAGDVLNLVVEDHSEGVKRYWYEANATWSVPDAADGTVELGFEDLGVSGSGNPLSEWYEFYHPDKFIYVGIVDHNSDLFDFNDEPFDNVGFECWMSGRENEKINQYSPNSGYKMYDSLASAIYFNIYDFETPWSEGDTLNISIKDAIPGHGYYHVDVQGVIDSPADEYIYAGLDAVYGPVTGGGDPLVLADWVDEGIKVYWGVVNAYGAEFTESDIEYVKYKAWVSRNVTDVVNETDPGNSVEIFSGIRGVCVIDMNSFNGWEWQAGDVLNIIVRDESDGLKDYSNLSKYSGYGDWEISADSSGDIFLGFEDYGLLGSGDPIAINTPDHTHELYFAQINVADKDSLKFDFNSEPYDNVTFQCWISGREFDIIDQEGSGYGDLGTESVVRIYSYDFQTRWNTGDTLNVSIKHDTPGPGYYTGTKKYVFTYTSTTEYWDNYIDFGFEGDPVIADIWVEDLRTMTYNCVRTDSTGYNFIALPYDAGYSKASDLGPDGVNINAVGSWIKGEGVWRSASHHPYFGWVNDYDVEVGQPYMINAVNSFDFTVTGDSIYIPPYEFIPSVANSFMIPLNRTQAQDTRDIWYEPGFDISTLYGYDPENQNWNSDGNFFTPTPFAIYPGMPMLGYSNSTFIWPSDKSCSDSFNGNEAKSKEFKAPGRFTGPKALILHIVDKDGNDFDLMNSTVSFKAWIEGNEYDIITQETPGSSLLTLNGMSVCYIETSRFWDVFLKDDIKVVVRDESADSFENWTIGSAVYNLGITGDPIFIGFESVIPGTGEPISTTEPSGLENINIPAQTELYQNYPNPFNPETAINFTLPKEEQVTLSVYNTKGELVKELVNGKLSSGNHSVKFNAVDLNSGVYYYTLESGSTKLSKKMLMIK